MVSELLELSAAVFKPKTGLLELSLARVKKRPIKFGRWISFGGWQVEAAKMAPAKL